MIGVVVIPDLGVVQLEGEDISLVVGDIVRRTEDLAEGNVAPLSYAIDGVYGEGAVFLGQHCVALLIFCFTDLAVAHDGVGLTDELLAVRLAEQHPIPISDGVVEVIGDIVDEHGLILS